MPPAMRTFPLGSKVAVCPVRGLVMLPVAVNVPCAATGHAPHAIAPRSIAKRESSFMFLLPNRQRRQTNPLTSAALFYKRRVALRIAIPSGLATRESREEARTVFMAAQL